MFKYHIETENMIPDSFLKLSIILMYIITFIQKYTQVYVHNKHCRVYHVQYMYDTVTHYENIAWFSLSLALWLAWCRGSWYISSLARPPHP